MKVNVFLHLPLQKKADFLYIALRFAFATQTHKIVNIWKEYLEKRQREERRLLREETKFILKMQKWTRLPREVKESLCLEVFKLQLDKASDSLI